MTPAHATTGCLLVTGLLAGCAAGGQVDPPASTAPVTRPPALARATPPAPHAGHGPGPVTDVLVQPSPRGPRQRGSADVGVAVSAVDGGHLTSVRGPAGVDAFRFPRYVASGAYPRAVIVVRDHGAADGLNPASRPFTWGADFRLDATSSGRVQDNGDNLVQRGLSSQPAMFKAELDLGRPACVVRGSEGSLTARSLETVRPGVWYHMDCRRSGFQLTVTSWRVGRAGRPSTRTTYGPTGDVTPADPGTPLSIGGKVAPDGGVVASATDQMNGAIADPFLLITRP